jgi:hypothetical protein
MTKREKLCVAHGIAMGFAFCNTDLSEAAAALMDSLGDSADTEADAIAEIYQNLPTAPAAIRN